MSQGFSPQSIVHSPQPSRPLPCGLWTVDCGLILVLSLSLTGCAVLSNPYHLAQVAATTSVAVPDDGYEDYVGVLHIHTTYSHDADGTFEDVIRVANAERLDYVIVTEHNTLQPLRDGKQGWHGATLALIGMEISARAGHYLALNVTQEIDRSKLTTQQVIDEVNRQGGFGFIAHPYFKKRRWTDWTVTGFTGTEIYNAAHDTLDENHLRLALWTLTVPSEPFYWSIIDRPYDPLRTWDALIAQRGRVVGIGASDAHEVHVLGLKFAPYEVMFQLVRTHVLIPSKTLTPEAIYDALRRGHAYPAIELTAEAKGFSFLARDAERVVGVMGDEVALTPELRLLVSVPTSAELTLFKDGQAVASTVNTSWEIPVTVPAVYRLEASRHGKPWIFSNPIYVRPAAPSANRTQQTTDNVKTTPQ